MVTDRLQLFTTRAEARWLMVPARGTIRELVFKTRARDRRAGKEKTAMKRIRLTALGFGGGVTLLMLVPFVNFVAMPVAVAGATALWCRQRERLTVSG